MQMIDHQIKGPMWKPEKTGPKKPKYIKVRVDREWLKTRATLLKGKANHAGLYTCEMCGGYTDMPEVDHKLKRSTHPELKHDFDNLQLLCRSCHTRKHGVSIYNEAGGKSGSGR